MPGLNGGIALLPVALLAFSSPAMANLAQDIAQSGAAAVTAEITSTAGAVDIPLLGDAPGLDQQDEAIGPATVPGDPQARGFAADVEFADTALGAAAGGIPGGQDPGEAGIQNIIAYWHEVALVAHQRDYSREDQGQTVTQPNQPGPCYTARALAMVHLAMYDAYVGITKEGPPYLKQKGVPKVPKNRQASTAASALGYAAFFTLIRLYPDDRRMLLDARRSFDELLDQTFGFAASFRGRGFGFRVSSAIIRNRRNDGSNKGPPFVKFSGSTAPFQHVPDPTAVDEDGDPQTLYAPHWGGVTPFGHKKSSLPDFLEEPVVGNEAAYLRDFIEVKDIGFVNSTTRTDQETMIGIFWAYDGALRIGTPPRLYAQNIDVVVGDELGTGQLQTGFDLVRLYAMTHVAMADATIAAWRDKYRFNLWRPIIGIRRADEDTVAGTAGMEDETWRQLGAPLTNRNRPGINPAFPAYPSGHATIGTSAFTVTKQVLGVGGKKYTMVSDEFNGVNEDETGTPRPEKTQSLSLDEAIEQNKRSRIFIGVHWQIDQDTGGELGVKIAQNIVANFPKKA